MKLRCGKNIVFLEDSPNKNAKVLTEETIKLNKIKNTHIPHIKNLLFRFNNNSLLLSKDKAIIIYDIYHYIYEIFRELYEFKNHSSYRKIIEIILRKIPELIQQCTLQINNSINRLEYDTIRYIVKCINQLCKVKQLASELESSSSL
jgi:hypothetical protein